MVGRRGRKSGGRTRRRSAGRARPAGGGPATRVARILWGLLSRPHGWSLEAVARELGVSERTLLGYVKTCREELVDVRGRALVELVRRGDRRLLRLADAARAPDSTAYQALSLFFAITVFQVLDGAGLEHGVDDLWTRFQARLPRRGQAPLADIRRKFYAAPDAVLDHAHVERQLDVVLRGLVNQQCLRLEHVAPDSAAPGAYELEPYTLALAGGTLQLIGRSRADGRIVRLGLDGLRSAALGADRFEYPPRYSPDRHADGVFAGEGEETEVSILLRSEQAVRQARARRLHRTQRFIRQQGGAAILSMRVRSTESLKSWLLSLGARAEVIAPRTLRDDVHRAHAEAAALYGR